MHGPLARIPPPRAPHRGADGSRRERGERAADVSRRAHRAVGPAPTRGSRDARRRSSGIRATVWAWYRMRRRGGARRRAESGAPRAGAARDAGAALHPHHPERGRAPPSRGQPQRGGAARRSHPGPLLARGRRSRSGGRSRRTVGSRPAARAAARTCVPTWCGSASSCRSRRSTRRGPRSTTATCSSRWGRRTWWSPRRACRGWRRRRGRGGGGQHLDGGTALGGRDPSPDRAGGAGAAGAGAGGVARSVALGFARNAIGPRDPRS